MQQDALQRIWQLPTCSLSRDLLPVGVLLRADAQSMQPTLAAAITAVHIELANSAASKTAMDSLRAVPRLCEIFRLEPEGAECKFVC